MRDLSCNVIAVIRRQRLGDVRPEELPMLIECHICDCCCSMVLLSKHDMLANSLWRSKNSHLSRTETHFWVECASRPAGPMDKASAYEAEDSRFDPWVGRCTACKPVLCRWVHAVMKNERLLLTMSGGCDNGSLGHSARGFTADCPIEKPGARMSTSLSLLAVWEHSAYMFKQMASAAQLYWTTIRIEWLDGWSALSCRLCELLKYLNTTLDQFFTYKPPWTPHCVIWWDKALKSDCCILSMLCEFMRPETLLSS